MSRRVQLVLLCEDKQHEVFARRFLNEMGWETRSMRVEKAPGGRGAGEQFVRKRFPVELKAHRTRPVTQALVMLIDGDAEGITARLQQFREACRESAVAERTDGDRVAIFIPTWNIETWLAYLDGEEVMEGKPDYPRLSRERNCQRHVEELARMCREGRLREPAPASLEAGSAVSTTLGSSRSQSDAAGSFLPRIANRDRIENLAWLHSLTLPLRP